MALRSGGRKLSFEILGGSHNLEEEVFDQTLLLRRSNSDPTRNNHQDQSTTENQKLGRKKRKKRKKPTMGMGIVSSIAEEAIAENGFEFSYRSDVMEFSRGGYGVATVLCEEVSETAAAMKELVPSPASFQGGKLRQRSVNGSVGDGSAESGGAKLEDASSAGKQRSESSGNVAATKLDSAVSLDWNRLISEDPNCEFYCATLFTVNFFFSVFFFLLVMVFSLSKLQFSLHICHSVI